MLFSNCADKRESTICDPNTCFICKNNMNNNEEMVISSITNKSYRVNKNLNCNDGGIYVATVGCKQQYSGKTTTPYKNRTLEHFEKIKTSTLFTHRANYDKCNGLGDCSVSFMEHY